MAKNDKDNKDNKGKGKGAGNGKGDNATQKTPDPTKYGVNKQQAALDDYNTQTQLRQWADERNAKGENIGALSIAAGFANGLTPEQQRYLYDYAGGKGYSMGNAFKDQYKDAAAYNQLTDPTKPYRPGSFKGAMADGGIGRKEIMARVDQRAEEKGKDFDKDKAYQRIASKWANDKNGSLMIGAAKKYANLYEKTNPFASMEKGGYGWLVESGLSKGKKGQFDLYRGINDTLTSGNYAKGDVLTALKNGGLRAGARQSGNLAADPRVRLTSGLGKLPTTTTNPNPNPNPNPDPTVVDTGTTNVDPPITSVMDPTPTTSPFGNGQAYSGVGQVKLGRNRDVRRNSGTGSMRINKKASSPSRIVGGNWYS